MTKRVSAVFLLLLILSVCGKLPAKGRILNNSAASLSCHRKTTIRAYAHINNTPVELKRQYIAFQRQPVYRQQS